MNFNKLKNFLLNLFFPKKCLGCGRADVYLCQDCFTRLVSARQDKIASLNNTCFFCGKITWQGKICLNCAKETGLDRVISATEYKNPLIRELIKAFKYHYVKELVEPLSKLLIKSLETFDFRLLTFNFLVVPIPLYSTRMRSRGFNQAKLLAREVVNYFNLPLETEVLKRTLPSIPQAKIKDNEKRKENIKNAFEVPEPSRVQGKIIILIDDVATTGATLIEASKILKNSGAKEVWALVIARGK